LACCSLFTSFGAEAPGSQRETRPCTGRILEEQVHDGGARQHREFPSAVVGGFFEERRRIEQEPDLVTRQPLEVEQVAVLPASRHAVALKGC
jgi:hypothetical protein